MKNVLTINDRGFVLSHPEDFLLQHSTRNSLKTSQWLY